MPTMSLDFRTISNSFSLSSPRSPIWTSQLRWLSRTRIIHIGDLDYSIHVLPFSNNQTLDASLIENIIENNSIIQVRRESGPESALTYALRSLKEFFTHRVLQGTLRSNAQQLHATLTQGYLNYLVETYPVFDSDQPPPSSEVVDIDDAIKRINAKLNSDITVPSEMWQGIGNKQNTVAIRKYNIDKHDVTLYECQTKISHTSLIPRLATLMAKGNIYIQEIEPETIAETKLLARAALEALTLEQGTVLDILTQHVGLQSHPQVNQLIRELSTTQRNAQIKREELRRRENYHSHQLTKMVTRYIIPALQTHWQHASPTQRLVTLYAIRHGFLHAYLQLFRTPDGDICFRYRPPNQWHHLDAQSFVAQCYEWSKRSKDTSILKASLATALKQMVHTEEVVSHRQDRKPSCVLSDYETDRFLQPVSREDFNTWFTSLSLTPDTQLELLQLLTKQIRHEDLLRYKDHLHKQLQQLSLQQARENERVLFNSIGIQLRQINVEHDTFFEEIDALLDKLIKTYKAHIEKEKNLLAKASHMIGLTTTAHTIAALEELRSTAVNLRPPNDLTLEAFFRPRVSSFTNPYQLSVRGSLQLSKRPSIAPLPTTAIPRIQSMPDAVFLEMTKAKTLPSSSITKALPPPAEE